MRTLTRDRRPIVLVPMRLGYRECVQVFGGFWQSFGRWGNCKSCLHARLFSCRLSSCKIVFMQIVFMQDCFHARLFSCKIVFMQDCFHADCLHARLFPCKIAFMQDFMQHAGGFLCIFAKMGPKSGPGGSKIDPGGSKIVPGGSKIDRKSSKMRSGRGKWPKRA